MDEQIAMALVSTCCWAPTQVMGEGETHYYACSLCGSPCDPVQAPDPEPK
jgi:hypothetical protein